MKSDLRLWEIDLDQSPEWIEAASARVLAADERPRPGEAEDQVRRRRLVARIALRIALSRALDRAPGELRLRRDGSGKPWLEPHDPRAPLHFNLSRTGDCCLIAVARGGPVGVDVEHVVPLPEADDIVRTRFAAEEARAILAREGADRVRAFFNCWTRKEAYLKARGLGLMAPLDHVVVTVGDEPGFVSLHDDDPRAWRLFAVPLGPDRAGAVAVRCAGSRGGGMLRPEALPLDRGG
ncbi:MAG: 4'-phosphopantetheinyl transferase superfamily protein [Thermoleophilaceae bacterium]|nr:4'-phosphopantetheinyl transferase superfamily protein [Thermoleophilaceae bacterium]